MYKCGWNGCEKAYGTLNHLNTHVAKQSHGQKRTPEGKYISRNKTVAYCRHFAPFLASHSPGLGGNFVAFAVCDGLGLLILQLRRSWLVKSPFCVTKQPPVVLWSSCSCSIPCHELVLASHSAF